MAAVAAIASSRSGLIYVIGRCAVGATPSLSQEASRQDKHRRSAGGAIRLATTHN